MAEQLRQQDSNGIEVKDMETEGDGETASSHTSEEKIENNDETLRSRVKVWSFIINKYDGGREDGSSKYLAYLL
ncbi:Hypothetical predicted protein [Paramuricea clavata]|uniref:Uncharacterized protein n=1 Tax=Paramuricea clavata TaxID=317549 RepID=A0A7D9EB67_PARCT|nr:Hypothetical predicted protein [Paramuricea clavata]